ncbi:MAG TPA: endonuclease III [Parvularculaceae bacterium]|nr:endonuclease III [Parvularculaceae bacterium]
MTKTLTRPQAAEIYRRLHAADPEPETELHADNPFTLLVAVVLSAQATDAGVNKATPALFKAASTPAKMAALGEEKLGRYIKTIGLWRSKAKNIIALSKILVRDFGGKVPQTREELETLPGVGRKSANVVLNVCFGQPTIAVDTHIFRVGNRTGLAPGKTPLEVEEGLLAITPERYLRHAHHWLILHGRYICLARKPKCPACPINDICLYKEKTPAAAPVKKKAAKKKAKRLAMTPKLKTARPKKRARA